MASLEILKYPDPALKEVSKEIKDFDEVLHKFLDDMRETMYLADGIGLAAPQVGKLIRVVVIDVTRDGKSAMDLVNPKILERDGEDSSEEGCLSIPGYRDSLSRNAKIKVQAFDRFGRPYEFEAEGLLAYCVQHEIDHLDGVLFIDRLSRLKKELFKRWFKKQQKPLE